jgi:hypothetical protein
MLDVYLTGDRFNKTAFRPQDLMRKKLDEAAQARCPAAELLGVADGCTELVPQKPSLVCRQFLFFLTATG